MPKDHLIFRAANEEIGRLITILDASNGVSLFPCVYVRETVAGWCGCMYIFVSSFRTMLVGRIGGCTEYFIDQFI